MDDEDNEVWYDFGKFSELDVHHQYAIVFRTPAYRDLDIEKTVDVYLQLYRPTDGDCSEAIKFSYKPSEKFGRSRKRHRSSLADEVPIPMTVTHGQNNVNGVIPTSLEPTENVLNTNSDPLLVQDNDNSQSELRNYLEENPMTSSEFKTYLDNLSISDYINTVENEDYMDLTTDGASKKPSTKASSAKKSSQRTDIPAGEPKFSTFISVIKNEPVIVDEEETSETLAQRVTAQLAELQQEKPPPYIMKEKITKIFAQKNEFGDSALHLAVINDQKDMLKHMLTVLRRGPYLNIINVRDKQTNTPLHCAVLENQSEFVKLLLSCGGDPIAVNRDGDTAIHMAVLNGREKCLAELLEKNNYLLSGAKPLNNVKNYEGWSPLHLAAFKNNLTAVKMLVEAGADVNELDSTLGRTVLHIAVEEGNKEITRFLVTQTNINVNLANYSGNTALHVACVVGDKGSPELCEILLAYKADPHKSNYEPRLTQPAHDSPDLVEIKEEPDSDGDFELKIDEDDDFNEDPKGQTSFNLSSNIKDADPRKSNYEPRLTQPAHDSPDLVEIKEEPDSDGDFELKIDEDDDYDEDPKGQTSFDLASNNADILKILHKVGKSMENSKSLQTIELKEEMCMSPISDCTIAEDNGLFDEETLQQLCNILDKSKSWVNLADLLDYGFLVPSIRSAPSPSKLLFNYADLHGSVTVQDIRNFLEALDEHKALEVVDLMLAKQSSSGLETPAGRH